MVEESICRQWRGIMVIQGGYRYLDQGGGVNIYAPDSGDGLWLDLEVTDDLGS
jgi:hypothetical protein